MVGKKSGKALLREEGLERTDNNMDLTSWPVVQPINQKNYYVDFLKRDEQMLAVRTQLEEARNKMITKAKDRDRALAQGRPLGPEGDMDMDDADEEEEEDELAVGNRTIVIHPGSQNLRIGLASDLLPKTVPMVIARQASQSESEEADGEPCPKRRKLQDGTVEPVPEKRFGDDFAAKFVAASNELKIRMRMNKRKVLPQSRDMVTSYNKRTVYDTITEHNDTINIDWTDVSSKPEYVPGRAALRIPDESNPRYKLFWPIQHGWVNENDYTSVRTLYNDIRLIIEDAVRTELKLELHTRKDWAQYNCVMVIPDYYDRTYVTSLLDLAIEGFGFARVCFIQESLAASFGAGFTTCCIVDIGAQKTSVCCVEDGMVIDNSRINLKMGGQDVTDTFIKMIIYNHFPYADVNLNRRYDLLLVEELKQKYSTIVEADISVQLYDFHLRRPGEDTRKYTFKIYDEVALPTLALFKPNIFDTTNKLLGRRKLIDKSYDIYDGKPNDPTSAAQAEILNSIAPPEFFAAPRLAINGKTNGHLEQNGTTDSDSRRPSMAPDATATPQPPPSGTSTPMRMATPQPNASTPLPDGDQMLSLPHEQPPAPPEPQSIEHRDLPVAPMYALSSAVASSINNAARGSTTKTRDLLASLLLIGGASKVPGMGTHLEETLQARFAPHGYGKQGDIIVARPPRDLDAEVVVWKGGAVFGRMSRTNDSWVTPFLYERLGERVLGGKLMWAW